MRGRIALLRTLWKLGVGSCARVVLYRLLTRANFYRLTTPVAGLGGVGRLLRGAEPALLPCRPVAGETTIAEAERLVAGELRFFGHHWCKVGSPPNWFWDPFSARAWPSSRGHWSSTDEFVAVGQDVKVIWDQSRFQWAVVLARAFAQTGREAFLRTLCDWLDHWLEHNPPNVGINWKCGQETSIRLLNFLEALRYIKWPESARSSVESFVLAHLHRIAATRSYAIAQNNNHGTSEAAALTIGGAWLAAHGVVGDAAKFATKMTRVGAQQLQERIARLVASDGSFAQYSVNYHRMLLDTVGITEAWSRHLGIESPLAKSRARIEAALDWLSNMTELESGDAPNIGANDGTLLLTSSATSYRDHRPTLQLVSCLFRGRRLFPEGPWDDACRYWGVDPQSYAPQPHARRSRPFMPGGFAVLADAASSTWCVLRVPNFRFRPSQADALHLDVWCNGQNVVRDTGSYSYNSDDRSHEYFTGTRAHSTCEFDGRDQMRRVGRFLFSDWLMPRELDVADTTKLSEGIVAAYEDYEGARHRRAVELRAGTWIIDDDVSGYQRHAVLRWYLAPARWVRDGRRVLGEHVTLEVIADDSVTIRLGEAYESRAYMQRTALPVLEVVIAAPSGKVRTIISPVR